jgi:thiol-disulfide isomerase/thioredoxin
MSRPVVFSSQDHADALARSKDLGKLLVLDAMASWCQPCKVMDRLTWVDPTVVAWIEEHAIAVQIDVDEQKDVAKSLGIRSMPTVIAFRGGVEVDRVVGLKKPSELVSWLADVQCGKTSLDQVRRRVQANPNDMQARYSLARTLANGGRFDEATNEYVWLWQHMTEHEPAMVGVRESFMLSEIGRLIKDHPSARKRFAELRDALGAEGVPATATRQVVTDWVALSVTLGEADRVLEWFDGKADLLDARPELEGSLRRRLVPVLMKRGRWADISRLFRDPVGALRQSYFRLEEAKKHVAPEMVEMLPKMIETLERTIRKDAGLIVASLLAAGRKSEARAVLEEARGLSPGAETERVVLETARNAGVALPE